MINCLTDDFRKKKVRAKFVWDTFLHCSVKFIFHEDLEAWKKKENHLVGYTIISV